SSFYSFVGQDVTTTRKRVIPANFSAEMEIVLDDFPKEVTKILRIVLNVTTKEAGRSPVEFNNIIVQR
ncbi:MAG: hypothetical protein AB8H47_17825, partial [Bacteroidia bacterium]